MTAFGDHVARREGWVETNSTLLIKVWSHSTRKMNLKLKKVPSALFDLLD